MKLFSSTNAEVEIKCPVCGNADDFTLDDFAFIGGNMRAGQITCGVCGAVSEPDKMAVEDGRAGAVAQS